MRPDEFDYALPPERIAERVSQPHAKTGERYDAAQRAGELAAHARQLSGELARARAFFDRTFGEVALGAVRVTSAPHA